MKAVLGMLLGEDPARPYDPSRYAPPERGAAPAPAARSAGVYGSAAPRRPVYGSAQDANPQAQPEPAPLGPWLVSQPGVWTPGGRQLQDTTLPLTARTQIATCSAPLNCAGTAASYEPETFMNPWETTQPVMCTGQIVNTYTGEVADVYEDALPPPNRRAGDGERERKQQQRRLMAAEGNVNASHRKREQQEPMQAGDAGVSTQLANFQIDADVALERNERAARDFYFNRNELAPTELEQTRNPFGFEGYNNRLRINPFMPVTQELDDKNWTPNATLLPGGDRPKQRIRLRAAPASVERMGLASGSVLAEDARAEVRRSLAARDVEGDVDAGRGAGAGVYGDAPRSAAVRLAAERPSDGAARGADFGVLAAAAGSGEVKAPSRREAGAARRGATEGAAAAAAAASAEAAAVRRREAGAAPARAGAGPGAAAAASAEAAAVRRREAGPTEARAGAGPGAAAAASAQAAAVRRSDARRGAVGLSSPGALAAAAASAAVVPRPERPTRSHEGGGDWAAAPAARSAAATVRSARHADAPAYREDYDRSTTDAKLAAGQREWRGEQLARPGVRVSAAPEGQRALLQGAREARAPRTAKSPYKGHRENFRGGLVSLADRVEHVEDVVDV